MRNHTAAKRELGKTPRQMILPAILTTALLAQLIFLALALYGYTRAHDFDDSVAPGYLTVLLIPAIIGTGDGLLA